MAAAASSCQRELCQRSRGTAQPPPDAGVGYAIHSADHREWKIAKPACTQSAVCFIYGCESVNLAIRFSLIEPGTMNLLCVKWGKVIK